MWQRPEICSHSWTAGRVPRLGNCDIDGRLVAYAFFPSTVQSAAVSCSKVDIRNRQRRWSSSYANSRSLLCCLFTSQLLLMSQQLSEIRFILI